MQKGTSRSCCLVPDTLQAKAYSIGMSPLEWNAGRVSSTKTAPELMCIYCVIYI